MSENDKSENDTHDDETQPVRREAAADLPPAPAAADTAAPAAAVPGAPARRGFRERFRAARQSDGNRAYSLGAVIASALAGVIVGGLGGMALHAAVDDHGPDRGVFRHGPGPWDRDFGERPAPPRDYREAPPMLPGEAPPTTTPDDEDRSPSESPSDQSSS